MCYHLEPKETLTEHAETYIYITWHLFLKQRNGNLEAFSTRRNNLCIAFAIMRKEKSRLNKDIKEFATKVLIVYYHCSCYFDFII